MGRKESNQTKNQTVYFAEACEMLYLLFDKLHFMFDL